MPASKRVHSLEDYGAFEWSPKRKQAAMLLAQGYTIAHTAAEVKVQVSTIGKWRRKIEFLQEIDRLSLMVDVAGRAERARIAMRAIRQKTKGEVVDTREDLLSWLKYIQSETQGAKLDLTALLAAILGDGAPVAGSGSAGAGEETPSEPATDEPK